ncbi:MAG: HK97 family phage prohead protease [Chloroflexi bacterium]|nr:HK97 family phage prohead protease [Chloroflexota bacterium]
MTTLDRFSADIKSVKKDGTGEFEAILSVPTLDRDGEVIDANAFEPLPDHIPIDVDHGMSVTTTVGSGVPYYDGESLMFRGSFASTPLGQEVRTLVTEGHVRKMSVAYMGSRYEEDEEDGKRHLRSAELLNAAIVAIPSNREADILAAKALEVDLANGKAGARNSKTDAETIQSMHDQTCFLGAKCAEASGEPEKSPTTDPEVKAAAAKAAAAPPADVDVARALAELSLAEADLSLS